MLIRDIKMYCSDMDNVDGYPLPKLLDYPAEEAVATRIALKLNEMKFELEDYCDLKLNFTPCVPNNIVQHALRTPRRNNAHYIDVGVTRDVFELLRSGDPAAAEILVPQIRHALLILYGKHHPERQDIREAIDVAISQGAEMEVCLMEKRGLFARGQVMVKYLDNGTYRPRLYVTDRQGKQLLDQELPDMEMPDQIKQIQPGFNKITVQYLYGDVSQETYSYEK